MLGVINADGEDNLQHFAEKYGIPVVAAWRRHDVFPNTHPLYVGHLQMGTLPVVTQTVKQADMIIAIGTRFNEISTQGYSLISDEQKIIHIDIEYSMLGKVYFPDLGVIADANEALADLLAYENGKLTKLSKQWVQERRSVYEEVTALHEELNTDIVDNKQIIRVLQKVLPSIAIITSDAGNFGGWMHSFFKFNERKTYIGATSGAMGYAMPAAIAAKLAHPEQISVQQTITSIRNSAKVGGGVH